MSCSPLGVIDVSNTSDDEHTPSLADRSKRPRSGTNSADTSPSASSSSPAGSEQEQAAGEGQLKRIKGTEPQQTKYTKPQHTIVTPSSCSDKQQGLELLSRRSSGMLQAETGGAAAGSQEDAAEGLLLLLYAQVAQPTGYGQGCSAYQCCSQTACSASAELISASCRDAEVQAEQRLYSVVKHDRVGLLDIEQPSSKEQFVLSEEDATCAPTLLRLSRSCLPVHLGAAAHATSLRRLMHASVQPGTYTMYPPYPGAQLLVTALRVCSGSLASTCRGL